MTVEETTADEVIQDVRLDEEAEEEVIVETEAEADIQSTEEANLEDAAEVHSENISNDPEFVEATQN